MRVFTKPNANPGGSPAHKAQLCDFMSQMCALLNVLSQAKTIKISVCPLFCSVSQVPRDTGSWRMTRIRRKRRFRGREEERTSFCFYSILIVLRSKVKVKVKHFEFEVLNESFLCSSGLLKFKNTNWVYQINQKYSQTLYVIKIIFSVFPPRIELF